MRRSPQPRTIQVCVRIAASLAVLFAIVSPFVLRADSPVAPNAWRPSASMSVGRVGAQATLLFDGRVLLTGGLAANGVTGVVERYDPVADAFSVAAPMSLPRAYHTATLLPDGRVLIAGGTGANGAALSAAAVYDPESDSWQDVSPLNVPRSDHSATALFDGRVVIAGGSDGPQSLDSVEVYDPWDRHFTLSSASLRSRRAAHAAALTYDGTVVVAGGFDGTAALSSIDVFDPFLNRVTPGASLSSARAGLTATTLLDGRILLLGGVNLQGELATGDVFNPATNTTVRTDNNLATPRQRHQAILLPHNNQVLIIGGFKDGAPVATAESYVAWQGNGGTFRPAAAPGVTRVWATATGLSFGASLTIRSGPRDGEILLAGGSGTAAAAPPLASTERYGFATIRTDFADYSPGQTVVITGSGWQTGESVTLELVEAGTGERHALLPAVANGDGEITSTEFVPDAADYGVRFFLTATDSRSQAQTSFTDAAANPGDGQMAVSPGAVAQNSAPITYQFTFTAVNDFNGSTSAIALDVPFGWAVPQTTTPGAAGYVTLTNVSCEGAGPVLSVSGQTVTATVSTTAIECKAGNQFRFNYANVSPPANFLGTFTFTTRTKGPTGALAAIASSPKVVVYGPASRLAFVQQPTTADAGVTIAPAITVEVRDVANNPVPTSSAAVTLAIGSNPGGATLGGTATQSAASGLATFSNLSLSQRGLGYTLVASSAGLTGATSAAFDILGTCNWVAGAAGTWQDATAPISSRWSCNRVPTVTDDAVIDVVGTVTIAAGTPAEAHSLRVGSGANALVPTVTWASGAQMNVIDDVSIAAPSATATRNLAVNAGALSIGGDLRLSTGATSNVATRVAKVTTTTGWISVRGDLVFNADNFASPNALNSQLDMQGGAGTFNLGGSFVINGAGTLTPGTTSIFNYNGTKPTRRSGTIGISSAIGPNGGYVATGTGTHFTTELSVGDRLYTADGSGFLSTVYVISSDTSLEVLEPSSAFGAFSGPQIVRTGGVNYAHLSVNNTSGAGATPDGAITTTEVTGSLRVGVKPPGDTTPAGGILNRGDFNITGGAGDTLEVGNGAWLRLLGTTSAFPTGFSTVTLADSSTVEYGARNDQTIVARNYGGLKIPPGYRTLTFQDGITVRGDYSWENNGGSYSVPLPKVTFNGTGIQNVRSPWLGFAFLPWLEVNKAGGVVVLHANLSTRNLTLTNGVIDVANVNAFYGVSAGGVLAGGSATSYVNASLSLGVSTLTESLPISRFVPTAKNNIYRPVNVTVTSFPASSGGNLEVEQFEAGAGIIPPGGATPYTARYWKLRPNPASTVTIGLDGTGFTPSNPAKVVIVKETAGVVTSYPTTFSSPTYTATGVPLVAFVDNNFILAEDASAPVVTIDSASPNPTTSGTTVTWHASENGPYSVRVGGTTCATGTVIGSGSYSTAPAAVATAIADGSLVLGLNTVRVCVADTLGNTGSQTVVVTKQVPNPDKIIGNGPSSPDGSYINAENIANTLAFTNVSISAAGSITIESDVDLSTSPTFGPAFFNLLLTAPTIHFAHDVKMGSGNLSLNASTALNLNGRGLTAAGALLPDNRFGATSPSPVINVLSGSASLQQAVAMAASGGTINVAAGEYLGALSLTKSVTLLGNTGDPLVAGADPGAPLIRGTTANGTLVTIGASNIALHGLRFDAQVNGGALNDTDVAIGGTGSNVTIRNNSFSGFDVSGIAMSASNNLTIQYNLFDDIGVAAIDVVGGTGHVIDHNTLQPVPTLSISAPSATATTTGPVSYTVTYTGATSVSLTPANIALNATGGASGTVTVSGSGATARTVTVSSIVGNGTLGISIAANTASNGGGSSSAAGPSATFSVDNLPPVVSSIVRSGTTPTTAATVDWTVTFAEAVSGVDTTDFALANSGLGSPSITGVSGGGVSYTVTANTGSGTGTLGLNLIDDDSIVDGAGNKLGSTGAGNGSFIGQTYSVSHVGPTVTLSRAAGQPSLTNLSPVHFTAVFSAPVTGFTGSDVDLGTSTTSGPLTAVVTESAPNNGTTFDVAVAGMNSNGTVIATIPSGVAIDSLGNGNSASGAGTNFVNFDRTTHVTVTSTLNPATYGTAFHFTAHPTAAVGGTLTGTVQFQIDGTNFGAPVALVGGFASSPDVTALSVGTHTVTASYPGTADLDPSSGTLSGGQLITAAPVTVTVACPASVTYTGAAQTPCTASVTGAGGLNQPLTVTYSNNVNAGANTATASAAYAGDANHQLGSDSKTFSIAQAPVTATAGSGSSPFDGNTHVPSACVVSGTYTGNLTCSNNPASVGPAAGSYAIAPVVAGTGLGNFAVTPVNGTFAIGSATVTVTVACPVSVTYTGSPHTPCTASYSAPDGLSGNLTPTYGNNTVVGIATASASYVGDANHAPASASKAFDITKATSTTAVMCGATPTYNGAAQTPCSASVTGVGGLNQSLTMSYGNNVSAGVNTATASASYAGDANHLASNDSKTFSIAQAPVTATAGSGSAPFDGNPHSPAACVVAGAYKGDLTCTNNPVSVGPAPGTYAIAPVVNGTGLTNFAITPVNGSFSIGGGGVTVTVSCPATQTYTGNALAPCTASYSSADGLNGTLTPAYTNNVVVGTAGATASFAGDATHGPATGSATFEITRAPSITTVACVGTPTYGGAPQTPCSASVGGVGGLSQAVGVIYSNNIDAGVNTATASASYAGDPNHLASSDSKTFSIARAPVTSTAGSGSTSFDSATHAPSACMVTGSYKGDLTCANNPASVGPGVGTYTIAPVVSGTGLTNFAITPVSGSYTISGNAVTVTVSCPTSEEYTGVALAPCTASYSANDGLNGTLTPAYTNNVNAGTASVSASFAGDMNHAAATGTATFAISRASSSTAVSCPASIVYTGAAQTPCTALATGVGGLSQSIGLAYSSNVNAGVATANASFAGDSNHSGSVGSKTFTITPAISTTTFGAAPAATYPGPNFTVNATSNSGGAITFSYVSGPCAPVGGATFSSTGTGTCVVQASSAATSNYQSSLATQSVSISAAAALSFVGLADPWGPPGAGTYNGMTFTAGRVYKINSSLPVKWGYANGGTLVDSAASAPELNVYSLPNCGAVDGTGVDTLVSYSTPGNSTTTYDPAAKMWSKNVKLNAPFAGDQCYMLQIVDPVTGVTSPMFPIKTKK